MSCFLRSTKAKLLSSPAYLSRTFSSLPHSTPQIGALSEPFQRYTATAEGKNPSNGQVNGLPNNLVNKLGGDSNEINSLRSQAFGLDTMLAGARYGTKVGAAKSPMLLLGMSAVMARNVERSWGSDSLGLTGHKRFMSDISNKTSQTKPSGFRPLSPHLPVYQPQMSSTLSIFNRIAGTVLTVVILAFYVIYMKMGLYLPSPAPMIYQSQLIPEPYF